jgi:short-subunit dehydrogenase
MSKGLVVITGASKGIGKAVAEKFLETGYEVAICARNYQELLDFKAKSKFGESIHVFQADLADENQVIAFCSFVQALQKTISCLIHNAGQFVQGHMLAEPADTLPKLMAVNVLSAYTISKHLIPTMPAFSHVFTVCSIASLNAYAESGSYTTTKFALLGFTKSLRKELIHKNIKVTAILPGATLTDSWAGVDLPAERFMPAEDIAEAVWGTFNLGPQTVVEEILLRPLLGDI